LSILKGELQGVWAINGMFVVGKCKGTGFAHVSKLSKFFAVKTLG
jgi:hypothetical protein